MGSEERGADLQLQKLLIMWFKTCHTSLIRRLILSLSVPLSPSPSSLLSLSLALLPSFSLLLIPPSPPPQIGHSSRAELWQRLLWHLPLSILALWSVGGYCRWWSTPDLQRQAHLHPFCRHGRVLKCSSWEGLRQVRYEWWSHVLASGTKLSNSSE